MNTSRQEQSGWVRPEWSIYPAVWGRYIVSRKKSEYGHAIRIEDILPERFDDVLDFMEKEFDAKEPISRCPNSAAILANINVKKALRNQRRRILEQGVSLYALSGYVQGTDILGVILNVVKSATQPFPFNQIEKYNHCMEIVKELKKGVDEIEIFGQEPFIETFGLCVEPKLYGFRIGYFLLKDTEAMAIYLKIRGALTTFTSKYAQKNALDAGFELVKEMNYEDFKDSDGNVKLPIEDTQSIMCLKKLYSENQEATRS